MPPLQLDAYFFTRLLVEVNEEFLTAPESSSAQQNIDLSLQVAMAQNDEDTHQRQITVQIEDVRYKEGTAPYKVEVEVVGIFTVNEEFKHAERERIIEINGASMLFGAAREQILSVTGRCPFGPFQLPTINLFGASKQKEPREA